MQKHDSVVWTTSCDIPNFVNLPAHDMNRAPPQLNPGRLCSRKPVPTANLALFIFHITACGVPLSGSCLRI